MLSVWFLLTVAAVVAVTSGFREKKEKNREFARSVRVQIGIYLRGSAKNDYIKRHG